MDVSEQSMLNGSQGYWCLLDQAPSRVRATLEGVACFFDGGASLAGVSVGRGRLLGDLAPGRTAAVKPANEGEKKLSEFSVEPKKNDSLLI